MNLSKRDFEDLGCEDVSGPQLRGRVFLLECLVAELALTLEEVERDLARQGFVSPLVMARIREVLGTVRERYNGTQPGTDPVPSGGGEPNADSNG